jgi:hypothetical protein
MTAWKTVRLIGDAMKEVDHHWKIDDDDEVDDRSGDTNRHSMFLALHGDDA